MNQIRWEKAGTLLIRRWMITIMLSAFFLMAAMSGCTKKENGDGAIPVDGTEQAEDGGAREELEQDEDDGAREEPEQGEDDGACEESEQGGDSEVPKKSEQSTNADAPADESFPELPEDWEIADSFLFYPLEAYRVTELRENSRLTSLYTILPDTGEYVRFRSMEFDFRTGEVEIRDMMQENLIFTSEAVLKENGEPENGDYYDHILRYGGWPEISTDVFGPIIYTGNDFSLHGTEYADKEEFLEEMGFAGEEPFYTRNGDMWGHSALELYYDESSGRGCGLSYDYNMSYEGVLMPKAVYGWSFEGTKNEEFVHDPYLLEMIGGGTGKSMQDYTETYQYRTDGRLRRFLTEGMMLHEGVEEMTPLIEIRYEYRDDGSLAYRHYYHDPRLWATNDMVVNSYYDEQERLVYEYRYITHGSIDCYYIYREGEGSPAYCLSLDSGGTYGVWLTVYES